MVVSGRIVVVMLCGQMRSVRGTRLEIVRVVDCMKAFVVLWRWIMRMSVGEDREIHNIFILSKEAMVEIRETRRTP